MNEKSIPAPVAGVNSPHGGTLLQLLVDGERAEELRAEAARLPTWELTTRQLCDVELLLNGAFSPLQGFLGREDYESVCQRMRLVDGTLWSIPVCLDVTSEFASLVSGGSRIALRHPNGTVLAVLTVTDIWRPDLVSEARLVYGTEDTFHSGVNAVVNQTNPVYIGGPLQGLELPPQPTFKEARHTPGELRSLFNDRGWTQVVAFQTRNPLHRAHVELTKRALDQVEGGLLIHPVVGQTKPGDVEHEVRVRCYQAVLGYYPKHAAMLSLLPLAMRMAGPREAVWHAIIRKNYGCTHFIVGRDHAGPGTDQQGKPFYGPYDAQKLVTTHEQELGIKMVPFEEMVYVEGLDQYMTRSEVPKGASVLSISGTELRNMLQRGDEVPEWYSFPEVVAELRRSRTT